MINKEDIPKKWLLKLFKKKWHNKFYICTECRKVFEKKDSDVKKKEILKEKYKDDRISLAYLSCLHDITCEKCFEPMIISIKESKKYVDKYREGLFGKNYRKWFNK